MIMNLHVVYTNSFKHPNWTNSKPCFLLKDGPTMINYSESDPLLLNDFKVMAEESERHDISARILTSALQDNHKKYADGDIGYSKYKENCRVILAASNTLNNAKTGGFAMKDAVELTQMRLAK